MCMCTLDCASEAHAVGLTVGAALCLTRFCALAFSFVLDVRVYAGVHSLMFVLGKGGCLVCSSKRLWNNSPILWLSLAAARAWPSACQNRQTDGRDCVPAGTWHHRAQECHCSSVTQRPTRFPGQAMSKRGWNWIISRMTQWITVKVLLTVIGNVWHESLGERKLMKGSLGLLYRIIGNGLD